MSFRCFDIPIFGRSRIQPFRNHRSCIPMLLISTLQYIPIFRRFTTAWRTDWSRWRRVRRQAGHGSLFRHSDVATPRHSSQSGSTVIPRSSFCSTSTYIPRFMILARTVFRRSDVSLFRYSSAQPFRYFRWHTDAIPILFNVDIYLYISIPMFRRFTTARRTCWSPWREKRSSRGWWWSSDTKDPRAGLACRRCSPPPRPSWGRDWATRWLSSPTEGSRAGLTGKQARVFFS